jgi:hypothetical protein
VTKDKIPDRTNLIIPDTKRTFSNDSSIGLGKQKILFVAALLIKYNFYPGYSVSSGKYLSKDKTLYATGAPSFNAQGKVMQLEGQKHNQIYTVVV